MGSSLSDFLIAYLGRASNILGSKFKLSIWCNFTLLCGMAYVLKLHSVIVFLGHDVTPFLKLPPVPAHSRIACKAAGADIHPDKKFPDVSEKYFFASRFVLLGWQCTLLSRSNPRMSNSRNRAAGSRHSFPIYALEELWNTIRSDDHCSSSHLAVAGHLGCAALCCIGS